MMAGLYGFSALTPLACGDAPLARKWADEVARAPRLLPIGRR